MSLGKSGGTQVYTPEVTPEQRRSIEAQTQFLTGTIIPTYQQAVGGARDIYNLGAPGITRAGQNLAGVAGQAQEALGSTGEAALRTGVGGLQSLFGRDYERQQLQAAMLPAQQQYQTNLQNLRAGFGGAGNLGSARQALAETALAGQTQASQQQTAAKVLSDIAAQRAAAGTTLANLGQGGLGQSIGAAQQGITAAQLQQDAYNRYLAAVFGTPQAAYRPDFSGTQGYSKTSDAYGFQVSPFMPGGVAR